MNREGDRAVCTKCWQRDCDCGDQKIIDRIADTPAPVDVDALKRERDEARETCLALRMITLPRVEQERDEARAEVGRLNKEDAELVAALREAREFAKNLANADLENAHLREERDRMARAVEAARALVTLNGAKEEDCTLCGERHIGIWLDGSCSLMRFLAELDKEKTP